MSNRNDDGPEFLYRFRSTESLLGEFQELERQEIFFASPDQLNDPVEGYKDFFWHGDAIIWKNFLRHYLLCLDHVCAGALIAGESWGLQSEHVDVFRTLEDLPTPQYKSLFHDICRAFFAKDTIASYPKALASRNTPIRREELEFYLNDIHYFALHVILSHYQTQGLLPGQFGSSLIKKFDEKEMVGFQVIQHINDLKGTKFEDEEVAEFLFQFLGFQGVDYVQEQMYSASTWGQNLHFILFDFRNAYLRQLERLAYPAWHTACFMEDYRNAAMWGHYGDGHKGVCLKFRTKASGGQQSISLNGVNGYVGTADDIQVRQGAMEFPFHKITYKAKYPELDFFRCLGRLPAQNMRTNWYQDEYGNESICGEGVLSDVEKWRESYWADFMSGITNKLEDWAYETEYRLILSSSLSDYREVEHRKFKYNFEDLDGIIFGINTSDSDKAAILKITQEKCRREKRERFNFYQAYYSRQSGRVETVRMVTPFFSSGVELGT